MGWVNHDVEGLRRLTSMRQPTSKDKLCTDSNISGGTRSGTDESGGVKALSSNILGVIKNKKYGTTVRVQDMHHYMYRFFADFGH